jgi:hypothetical protein
MGWAASETTHLAAEAAARELTTVRRDAADAVRVFDSVDEPRSLRTSPSQRRTKFKYWCADSDHWHPYCDHWYPYCDHWYPYCDYW